MDLGLSRLLKGEMTIFIPQVIKQVNIGVAYLEIEKDAACMHTELSAVLNSCFVNNIGITIESADTCSDFFPEIQNLSSLVFLSLVIEGTPSGKILLTCHDLLPQSKMHA